MNLKNKFVLIVFLCLSFFAHADENQVLGGSITEHFFPDGAEHFKTKLGDSGKLIYNSMVGWRNVTNQPEDGYISSLWFGGSNSIGGPMFGYAMSMGQRYWSNKLEFGVIGGAYLQDDRPFLEDGIIPVSVFPIAQFGVMPVVGIELNLKIPIEKGVSLIMMNIITPVLYNASLGIAWEI